MQRRQVGVSSPAFTVAEVFLGGDATDDTPAETVAMTCDAGRIGPTLSTDDGTDVRVELMTVVTGHGSVAGELVAGAGAMIAEDPKVHSPQPGTVLEGLGAAIDESITAKHGLLIVPFVWGGGVPQVHEVNQSGGKRSKEAREGEVKQLDFTHPGRLTVVAQLVMLNDEELALYRGEAESGEAAGDPHRGFEIVQQRIAEGGINLNDVFRAS